MPLSLLIGSYVAGSRVGVGIGPFVFSAQGVDPIVLPTTLLGRHPGWGDPGGGPTPPALLEGMIQGLADNAILGRVDAIYTGYFATPEHVHIAADLIDLVRKARGPSPPLVCVDPVMGDAPGGLYISAAAADALEARLVSKATLLTPNAWEAERLTGVAVTDVETAHRAAKALGADAVVTSVTHDGVLGALASGAEGAAFAGAPYVSPTPDWRPPYGTGDVLAMMTVARRLHQADLGQAVADSVGVVAELLRDAEARRLTELPVSGHLETFARPPAPPVFKLRV